LQGGRSRRESTSLDLPKFVSVLKATSTLVESGFDEEHVRSLGSLAERTLVGQCQGREFPIVYRSRKSMRSVARRLDHRLRQQCRGQKRD
jgi:hypothetical protein